MSPLLADLLAAAGRHTTAEQAEPVKCAQYSTGSVMAPHAHPYGLPPADDFAAGTPALQQPLAAAMLQRRCAFAPAQASTDSNLNLCVDAPHCTTLLLGKYLMDNAYSIAMQSACAPAVGTFVLGKWESMTTAILQISM